MTRTTYTALALACKLLASFQTILNDADVFTTEEADDFIHAVAELDGIDSDIKNYAESWLKIYIDVAYNGLDHFTAERRAERIFNSLNSDIDEGLFR